MSHTPDFKLILGYRSYSEIDAINRHLVGSRASIVEVGPDLQSIIDAIASLKESQDGDPRGLIVLLNPDIRGYAPDFIQQLLFDDAGPIPVIGYSTTDTSNLAAIMKKHGATHFFELTRVKTGTQLVAMVEDACEQVWADREAGNHHMAPDIQAAPAGAIRQQCITIYLPKGGSSSRTTTATNVGAYLAALGNPTIIVDFDPTKGDVHTVLGFTADHTSPLTHRFPLIDRGLFDLVTGLAANWGKDSSVAPAILRKYIVGWEGHRAVGKNLHILPGLLNPNMGGRQEWKRREADIYDIARAILRTLKTLYLFVIVDIGQDYNQPLVAAALDEATDVLVPIPPNRPAIMAVQRALPMVLEQYGTHNKFRWFPAAWLDNVNAPTFDTINDALGIPKLGVKIPCDPQIADQAVNDCVPFVLWDDGPLGTNMKLLAGNYDQRAIDLAKQTGRKNGLLKRVTTEFFRGA